VDRQRSRPTAEEVSEKPLTFADIPEGTVFRFEGTHHLRRKVPPPAPMGGYRLRLLRNDDGFRQRDAERQRARGYSDHDIWQDRGSRRVILVDDPGDKPVRPAAPATCRCCGKLLPDSDNYGLCQPCGWEPLREWCDHNKTGPFKQQRFPIRKDAIAYLSELAQNGWSASIDRPGGGWWRVRWGSDYDKPDSEP
jgi:hypothetical protein